MYTALCTTLSLDDAYDLAEIDQVSRSWRDATQANGEGERAKAKPKGRRGAVR